MLAGFKVQYSRTPGFRVQGLMLAGFRVQDSRTPGFRVQGLMLAGFRVQDSVLTGFRCWVSGNIPQGPLQGQGYQARW